MKVSGTTTGPTYSNHGRTLWPQPGHYKPDNGRNGHLSDRAHSTGVCVSPGQAGDANGQQ